MIEKKFEISLEELSRFLQIEGHIYRTPFEKEIYQKFATQEEFLDYIKVPEYPEVYTIDPIKHIPPICGFCVHYSDGVDTFSTRKCLLFPRWPIRRSLFNSCGSFEWHFDRIERLSKTDE